MNCPKCNATLKGKFCGNCGYQIPMTEYPTNCKTCSVPLKQNAKFCGGCGAQVITLPVDGNTGSNCRSCGAALKQNAKFCGLCGATVIKLEQSQYKQEITVNQKSITKVGSRISWEVHQGELGLRINETEFLQYDDATGIIINDGIHTVLKANGTQVAELKSGIYDFIEKKELESALNTRVGGATGAIRRGFRFFSNLILGTRIKDKIEEQNAARSNNQVTFNRVVDDLKNGAVFSATMILEKSFPLIFEFEKIRTKFLDSNVALHAFFKVNDFTKFTSYYLVDKSLVSFEMVRAELHAIIESTVANIMIDFEQENLQLPESFQQILFAAIQQISPEMLNGISIEKIVTVTSNNEDLERLRGLSRELYLSEIELDHQQRLAEFRNRMALQVNAQLLNDARTETDFNRVMNEINKDGILAQDDFDKFLMVFSKEKLIRESKNDEDIEIALNEIRKTGLLREEDMEVLQRTIEERREDHQRNRLYSLELMQMDHISDIDRKQLEWEFEIGDKRIQLELDRRRRVMQADIGFIQLEIEQTALRDDYGDVRRDKDLDFESRKKKTQIEIDREEMQAQLEQLRQANQIRQEREDAEHRREALLIEMENAQQLALEQKKIEAALGKLEKSKDLTPEQLMAIAANENLSPEAAKVFAESFSAKHEAGSNKEFMDKFNMLNENRINDLKKSSDDQRDFMEKMMNKVLETQASMTGHLVSSQKDGKEEYRERLNRTEDRLDNTQDKALNYTTRNTLLSGSNIIVDMQNIDKKECSICKFLNDLEVKVCIECGNKF
jgi:hypothetical protein